MIHDVGISVGVMIEWTIEDAIGNTDVGMRVNKILTIGEVPHLRHPCRDVLHQARLPALRRGPGGRRLPRPDDRVEDQGPRSGSATSSTTSTWATCPTTPARTGSFPNITPVIEDVYNEALHDADHPIGLNHMLGAYSIERPMAIGVTYFGDNDAG